MALGVFPQPFFKAAERDLEVVADIAGEARKRVKLVESERAAVSDRGGAEVAEGEGAR